VYKSQLIISKPLNFTKMKTIILIIFLLLGSASTLMSFIAYAYRGGKRNEPEFAKGLNLSMAFVIIALILFFYLFLRFYY